MIKFLFSATILSLLAFSGLAHAAPFPKQLCTSEFGVAQVTHKKDASFYVCSSVPAAYISHEQAQEAAVEINTKQANIICPGGFQNVSRPKVFPQEYSVTVVSLLACH